MNIHFLSAQTHTHLFSHYSAEVVPGIGSRVRFRDTVKNTAEIFYKVEDVQFYYATWLDDPDDKTSECEGLDSVRVLLAEL